MTRGRNVLSLLFVLGAASCARSHGPPVPSGPDAGPLPEGCPDGTGVARRYLLQNRTGDGRLATISPSGAIEVESLEMPAWGVAAGEYAILQEDRDGYDFSFGMYRAIDLTRLFGFSMSLADVAIANETCSATPERVYVRARLESSEGLRVIDVVGQAFIGDVPLACSNVPPRVNSRGCAAHDGLLYVLLRPRDFFDDRGWVVIFDPATDSMIDADPRHDGIDAIELAVAGEYIWFGDGGRLFVDGWFPGSLEEVDVSARVSLGPVLSPPIAGSTGMSRVIQSDSGKLWYAPLSEPYQVALIDPVTGAVLMTTPTFSDTPSCRVAAGPDGTLVDACSFPALPAELVVWDPCAGRTIASVEVQAGPDEEDLVLVPWLLED